MAELGEPISDRELEVLHCVAEGASNREIALDLDISHNTVKVHLRNIYAKLGVSSRTEATTVAIQQGLLRVAEGKEIVATPATAVQSLPTTAEVEPGPKPGPTGEQTTSEMTETVAGAATGINWRVTVPILVLLVLLIGSLFGLRAFNGRLVSTPNPFTEEPVGETRWSTSRAMPEGRASMAVASVGLNVYQIGGETSDSVVDTVSVFDTGEKVWREAASKPTAVTDASAAVLFGEVYVPGGRLADGQPTDVVEVYSPANDAWRPVAALPQPIAGGLALSDGSFLYLFGGWDGERYLDVAYVYDPVIDGWRPLPSMTIARAHATGGVITGQLYVVGGFDGEAELAQCQLFEPATETWSGCPSMLLPRAGAGATVLVNKLYVIGGGLQADNEVRFSEFYDPKAETWQVVNTPMLADSSGWVNLGITNVETHIYALGGRRDGQLRTDNYVFAPFVYQTFIPAASSGGDN